MRTVPCQSTTVHDTLDAYMHHNCRCPAARAKHMRRMKAYRLRRMAGETPWIDATGTRRRIQALSAIGWSFDELGTRLGGVTRSQVSQYASPRRKFVTAATAAAVHQLYVALADTPGPSRYNESKARGRGWLPPLWWDDDTIDDPAYVPALVERRRRDEPVDPVVVDRLIDGTYQGQRPTRAERRAAFTRMLDAEMPLAVIQQHLRLSGTSMRALIADAAGITSTDEAAA